MRINAESIRAKVQRREEEKLLDMKDAEYVKKKLVSGSQTPAAVGLERIRLGPLENILLLQEREAEYEAEQKRVKKERELEITRLRAQQQRARDHRAEQVSQTRLAWPGLAWPPQFGQLCLCRATGRAPGTETPGKRGPRMEEKGEGAGC